MEGGEAQTASLFCLSCRVKKHFNDPPLCSGGNHRWCVLCRRGLTQGEWDARRPNRTHGLKDDGAFRWSQDANRRPHTGERQVLQAVVLLIQPDWVTPTIQWSLIWRLFIKKTNVSHLKEMLEKKCFYEYVWEWMKVHLSQKTFFVYVIVMLSINGVDLFFFILIHFKPQHFFHV